MGKIIVFANQKGGVGKTTTTANIGSFIAAAGKKVLLVDFDPQGNLSSTFGIRDKKCLGIYDALTRRSFFGEIVQETKQENLFIAPSSSALSGASVELVAQEKREFFLKNILSRVKKSYDYILIDCPPSLDLLTINGLAAADAVIIPLQCEFFALEGLLAMLVSTIQMVKKNLNKTLKIEGIVFTMYDSRTRLSNEVIQRVKATFADTPEILFDTLIPRNVRLSEAPSHGKPINLYDASCVGGRSYKKLAEEVMARG